MIAPLIIERSFEAFLVIMYPHGCTVSQRSQLRRAFYYGMFRVLVHLDSFNFCDEGREGEQNRLLEETRAFGRDLGSSLRYESQKFPQT